jgi:hypothetical protein
MRTLAVRLARLLQSNRPLVILFYDEPLARERLMAEIEVLAPDAVPIRRSSSLQDAFSSEPGLLLLTPQNEREAVELLEGGRELLRERPHPVVLFLLRGGAAQEALAELPGLSSWVNGVQIDAERAGEVDVEEERSRFQEEVGRSPEEWLADYRAGRIPDTQDNFLRSHRALFLERPT